MSNKKLPATERVAILAGRVAALKRGAGEYPSQAHRIDAQHAAKEALAQALADVEREAAGRA